MRQNFFYSRKISYIFYFCLLCFFSNPSVADGKKLVFSNDIKGKLEPCGCDESSSFGGLARRHFYLLKNYNPDDLIFIDAGNILFEDIKTFTDKMNSIPSVAQILGAEVITRFLTEIEPITAVNVGKTDLALGLEFIKKTKIPFISLNLLDKDGNVVFPAFLENGNFRFWGITRPHKSTNYKILELGEIKEKLDKISMDDKFIDVLLTDLEMADLEEIAKKFNLVVLSRIVDEEINTYSSSPIFSVRLQGRDIGIASISDENNFEVEFFPLSSSVKRDDTTEKVVRRSDIELRKLSRQGLFAFSVENRSTDKIYYRILTDYFLELDRNKYADVVSVLNKNYHISTFYDYIEDEASIDTLVTDVEIRHVIDKMESKHIGLSSLDYVSSTSCFRCHQSQYKVWRHTLHSKAFDAIEKTGNGGKLGCYNCHVTGYHSGGIKNPSDYFKVRSLINVGCEACHGSGRIHSRNPKADNIKRNVAIQQVCVKCHITEHSKDFREIWKYAIRCDKSQFQRNSDPEVFLYANCVSSGCHRVPEKWNQNIIGYDVFVSILENGLGIMPKYDDVVNDVEFTQRLYETYVKFKRN